MLTVLVAGFTGKMGQQVVQLLNQSPDYKIVAALAPSAHEVQRTDYHLKADVALFSDLTQIDVQADVWLDFTTPSCVYRNITYALQHGFCPLIGTSGLSPEQIGGLQQLAKQQNLGGLIAPNFSLSAVLLLKLAQIAVQYFPDTEIIELHHADKQDAPSATALQTAHLLSKKRMKKPEVEENDNQSRGMLANHIPIHSVRLPGYLAHEQVLFGSEGEALTISQDTFSRSAFMRGVDVALQQLPQLTELVVGLENLL